VKISECRANDIVTIRNNEYLIFRDGAKEANATGYNALNMTTHILALVGEGLDVEFMGNACGISGIEL
jgi:hypothetical protein